MNVLLLIFFFVSGASGLIYEIVWTKMLTLVIGSTVYSISTVLVAFMGGLAIGSYVGGRIIDRKGDPFLVYGVLEGLIGLYCLVIPFLISSSEPLFAFLYNRYYTDQFTLFSLLRFVVCVVILIPPTSMMGATLPVLSRFFAANRDTFGKSVGRLYTINTLGAALGSFGAGFILLPMMGKSHTIMIAAAGNIFIALCVMVGVYLKKHGTISSKASVAGDDSMAHKGKLPAAALVVLIAYAMNGFSGMAYQSAWARAFSLSLGASSYAFSLIVTAFILGLAGGAGYFSRIVDRIESPMKVFGWIEMGVGFSAIGVLWALGRLPRWMVPLIMRYSDNYDLLMAAEFAVVFLMILAPTFLMGATFPLAVKCIGDSFGGAGRPVGLAYGWNTAGAIAGSFVAGFVLIPLTGLERTITTANAVNWIAGAGLLYIATAGASRMKAAVVPIAVVVIAVVTTMIVPRWDERLMDSGPFIYAGEYMKALRTGASNYWSAAGEQVFYDEGLTTTVSVRKSDAITFLRVNGKTDASTGSDMSTQVLSGHLPLIFNPRPKDVLVIGLASGVTAGAVATYPTVEHIDVVEIAESVIEACRRFFGDANHNVLDDPRVRLIVGDGRTHLRDTQRKYDAIVSEPSNPWIAGISTLFTREFFEAGRDRLNPGGAMLIWIQGYGMDGDNIRSVIGTFSKVFPTVIVWEMGVNEGADYGILGFRDDLNGLDCDALKTNIAIPGVAADLARIGVKDAPTLLSAIMFGPHGVSAFGANAREHRDDHPFLEYLSPRTIYSATTGKNIAELLKWADDPVDVAGSGCLDGAGADELTRVTAGRREYLKALVSATGGDEVARERMIVGLENAVRLDGDNRRARSKLRDELYLRAAQRMTGGDFDGAIGDLKRLYGWFPADGELYYLTGVALYKRSQPGDAMRAIEEFRKAVAAGYEDAKAYHDLATALLLTATGGAISPEDRGTLLEEAASNYRKAVAANGDYISAWNGLGSALVELGRNEDGKAAFEKAIAIEPSDSSAYINLAGLMIRMGDTERAATYLDQGERNSKTDREKARFAELKRMLRGK